MYSRPSSATTRAPHALAMKRGSPPTARKARTGLLTPPGMTARARSKRALDWGSDMRPLIAARRRLGLGGVDALHQLGDGGEQIGHEAVVGDLEDGRVAVLVDGDDDLGSLHPGEVLDRARDADGEVERRGHDLAGLPDLE